MATSGALSTSNTYVKYTITITQNSQSVANNTSNVTVSVRFYRTNTGYVTYGTGTVYCKIDGTTYSASVTPSQQITSSGIVLFTKTLNIAHGTNGAKTLTCSAWISHNAPLTSNEQSYSQALTTIPRKSTLAVANGTLNTAQTLTVTRQSTSFTHTITYACDSASGTICTKSSTTSISWTPPLSLASQNTTGTSVSITLTITTYNGSTSIGSNIYTISCAIPTSVAPTVSIALSDANGYSSTYGGYVQTKSAFKIVLTAAGSNGSTIKSYSTTADGKTYTTASFTTSAISGSGTMTITATVTDTRGRTATATTTASVLAYAAPKISSFSIQRCNSDGTNNVGGSYLSVIFSSTITSLSSKNSAAYVVKYKKSSATSYTSATLTSYAGNFAVSNGKYVFAADTTSSYDITLTATDKFSSVTVSGTGSSAGKLISLLSKGLGVAIGKIAEKSSALEVAFDTYLNKALTVLGNTSLTGTLSVGGATTMTGAVTAKSTVTATGNVKTSSSFLDSYGLTVRNGLAAYNSSSQINPDTTLEELILTNNNTPMGSSYYMFIRTMFYSTKSTTARRAQWALPYTNIGSMYHRYYNGSVWSSWRRHSNADEARAYVVSGNVVITVSATTAYRLHAESEVVNAFKTKYGITVPTGNSSGVYGFAMNGDTTAQSVHIDGMSYNSSNGYYILFDRTATAGNMRVRYCYIYWGVGS